MDSLTFFCTRQTPRLSRTLSQSGAAAALRKSGAITELVPYEGGYGWHGDVYAQIRRGIRWLEDQQQTSQNF
jgi:hypothetical protein